MSASEIIYGPKQRLKYVYRTDFRDKDPAFKVCVRKDGFDCPEYCGHHNKAGHIIPYPETLQAYIFPLIKSAGLGENGLSFEREYIVSNKKRGLIYRGLYNAFMWLGDMQTRSWSYNDLSFGAHYIIKDSNDFEIFHAKILQDSDIKFEVTYYFSTVLEYRYRWRAWSDGTFVYDLDYDAMEAVTSIFNVLESVKTRYRPQSSYFDVVGYMEIPKWLRPQGSFFIPLSPGANGLASRHVRRVLSKMNYLCSAYESENLK